MRVPAALLALAFLAVPASAQDGEPPRCEGLTVTSHGELAVTLAWAPVPGAEWHQLLARRDGGEVVPRGNVTGTGDHATLEGLAPGVWTFWVHHGTGGEVLRTDCGETHLHSEPTCPDLLSVSVDGHGRIEVLWSPYPDSVGANVTLERPGTAPQTLPPFDPHVTGFLHEDAEPGVPHTFTIAFTLASGATVTSCPATATVPTQVPFLPGVGAVLLAALGVVVAAVVLRR